jgi:hypothetical protein
VSAGQPAARHAALGEEDQVEEVDAVAVFAQPPQGTKGAEACDDGRLEGERNKADGDKGDG